MIQATPSQNPYLVSIGNIHATDYWIVTPSGTWELSKTNVMVQDNTMVTTHTPAWAVIMVLLFIWVFFLSLLFLLARETRMQGYVAVMIQSGGQTHVEHVRINAPHQKGDTLSRVAYLQTLIGNARARGY